MQTGKALGRTLANKPPKEIADGCKYDVFVHEQVNGQRVLSLWAVPASEVRKTQKDFEGKAKVVYRDIRTRLRSGIHPGD